jgi:hypothetical protein
MGTALPDLFSALAAPIDKGSVKVRSHSGRSMEYITARTVMNRLDDVVGPCNWWDDYTAFENSVLCRLTIRLPDGTTLTKADAGGHAGMADQGDDDKSAYSDSLKRAAVKFGIARELYRDGVADFARETPVTPAPVVETVSTAEPAKPEPARDERTFWQFASDGCGKYNDRFREAVGNLNALNICNAGTMTSLLWHEAFEAGKLATKPSPEMDLKTAVHHMEEVYANHRPWAQVALKRLLKESFDEAIRNAKAAPVEDKG